MSKKLLVSSLIAALAQAGGLPPGFAAEVNYSNTANQSATKTIEVQIMRWIDRYVADFGNQGTFATQLRSHLGRLMLQEDSTSFLKNLVDRGALRRNTTIESVFEEYVHFITWQSLRRLPDTHVPQYLNLMINLSRGASEDLCKEYLHNKSTIGFARPKDKLRAISTLSEADQAQYVRLVDLGFQRLTSGAYPQRRLSEGQVTSLQDSYRLFQRESPMEAGNCGRVRAMVEWTQTIESQVNVRADLWLNGLLPLDP
jgi:hypothetical protein